MTACPGTGRARAALAAASVAIMMNLSTLMCAGAESDEGLREVRGRISDIDWVGSTISIKWFTSSGNPNEDEMVFTVPHRASITKAGSSIGLSELNVSDKVAIVYRNDPVNGNRVESIDVAYAEVR